MQINGLKNFFLNLQQYFNFLGSYFRRRSYQSFQKFETAKDALVGGLVIQRGKYVRPFLHSTMSGLFLIGLMVAPLIKDALPQPNNSQETRVPEVLAATSVEDATTTKLSVKPRDSVVNYTIDQGDTISSIAQKFGVSEDSILWQNNLEGKAILKPGQQLQIPPVTGVVHKVKRGDTIYSIAKLYGVDAQNIVNWPFNSFSNDEDFSLAVGQLLVIPDGVMPEEEKPKPEYLARQKQIPQAGLITGTGQFIWPASGTLTQYFVWYHPALDIANSAGPNVLAADDGTVISVISQRFAYGNHIIIDHGNGFTTLYAHLASFLVNVGDRVSRGTPIGKMGSTGRSTGTHLHFEIRQNGVAQNPLSYLK